MKIAAVPANNDPLPKDDEQKAVAPADTEKANKRSPRSPRSPKANLKRVLLCFKPPFLTTFGNRVSCLVVWCVAGQELELKRLAQVARLPLCTTVEALLVMPEKDLKDTKEEGTQVPSFPVQSVSYFVS